MPDWEWYFPMVCYIQVSVIESSQKWWHMGQEAVLECVILFLEPVIFFSSLSNEREGGISIAQSSA